MRRVLRVVVTAVVALGAWVSVVSADEVTAKDYIEFLKPFAGSWKTELEVEGNAVEGTWVLRLVPKTMCFLTHGGSSEEGYFQTIDGYDPASKKWLVAGFSSKGEFSITKYDFKEVKGNVFGQGSVAAREVETHKSDGTTLLSTSTMTCVEYAADRIVLQFTECKEDGNDVPDGKFTMQRAELERLRVPKGKPWSKEALESKTSVAFMKPMLGDWKVTIEVDGKTLEGTFREWMSPAKTCCLVRVTVGGLADSQGIEGYDPASKTWTAVTFSSDETFSLARMTSDDVKKGRVLSQGGTATMEECISEKDGSTTRFTAKAECRECTKDRIVIVNSDRKETGESKPDLTLTMERTERPKRKAAKTADR